MAEDSFLTDDLLRQLISVGEVDLLVGVPSQNNADTIGHTVEAIEESFQQAFPRQRVVIVNVDAGSNDGTTDIFLNSVIRKNANSRGFDVATYRTTRGCALRERFTRHMCFAPLSPQRTCCAPGLAQSYPRRRRTSRRIGWAICSSRCTARISISLRRSTPGRGSMDFSRASFCTP